MRDVRQLCVYRRVDVLAPRTLRTLAHSTRGRLTFPQLLAGDFPENRELRTFLTTHDPVEGAP